MKTVHRDARLYSARHAILVAAVGAAEGAIGAAFARPLVTSFQDSAPWVFPGVVVGTVAALILAGLLLPLVLAQRRRRDVRI
ncbi:MAG: hypothetical protein ABI881_15390 [Betaproteobacteria bacterium]